MQLELELRAKEEEHFKAGVHLFGEEHLFEII